MAEQQVSVVASKGDAVLVLDSGKLLPFHSTLLELRSQPLADAIALATEGSQGRQAQLRLPLPSTSDEAAQLLLAVAYSQHPERLLQSWDKLHLLALARLCHRFALVELQTMIDEASVCTASPCLQCCSPHLDHNLLCQALVFKCGAQRTTSPFVIDHSSTCLMIDNVVSEYWDAHKLGLQGFEAECAAFIGQHAGQVAQEVPSDPLCRVLREAANYSMSHAQLRSELRTIKRSLCSGSYCSECSNAVIAASRPVDALLSRVKE